MYKLLARTLAIQSLRKPQMAKMIMAIASLCGIIGFLVHGFIDFGWRLPANVFFAMTLLALCVTSLESLESKASIPDAPGNNKKHPKTVE